MAAVSLLRQKSRLMVIEQGKNGSGTLPQKGGGTLPQKKQLILIAFVITLIVWAIFSWPLPRYLAKGIPASSTNVEQGSARRMIAGDHLQLLYHYWLSADMLLGKTPFWYNLYEFNTGDDDERFHVTFDNYPFSLIFTPAYAAVNRAFAWNLLGFVSLYLGYLFCWLLTRRYTKEHFFSALGALMILFLPYRWATLLGGSPTGIAMMLPPMLFLGLDIAVRDRRLSGGLLAGLAILFASWNDAHIFFMGMLAAPIWCLVAFVADHGWKKIRQWPRIILALVPFVLIAGAMILNASRSISSGVPGSTIESGRSLHEIALCSPKPEGLIRWFTLGHDNSIFIGRIFPALLIAGFLAKIVALVRRKGSIVNILVYLLILGGTTLALVMAMGTNGPNDAELFITLKEIVPHYDMIRQPAKIMSIIPPLLAVLLSLALIQLNTLFKPQQRRVAVLLLLAVLLMGVIYSLQVRATICLLDKEQGAYAAVAKNAKENEAEAHALIIPLWPGDSAWGSLYEYYVSLYRIRMINGYRPVVPIEYINDIFFFFEGANSGVLFDEQLDDLMERGIEYIIFHEDAFPEKVSSFPATATLQNLIRHRRLKLLQQDANIWSFKIVENPRHMVAYPAALETWDTWLPSGIAVWEAERGARKKPADAIHDPAALGQHYMQLTPGQTLTFYDIPHGNNPKASLLIRTRGHGTLQARAILDKKETNIISRTINSDSWQWSSLPLGPLGQSVKMAPALEITSGMIDVDALLLFAGEIPNLSPGESWTLPAPLFFHAGYTDFHEDSIVLRPAHQSDGGRFGVFYGPNLPLPAGSYEIILHTYSEAPPGTNLGSFYIQTGREETKDFSVIAGHPATGTFTSDGAHLICLRFTYSRQAPLHIKSVEFKRVAP